MENLKYYYSVVEKAIAKIGVDPAKTRTQNAGKWNLTKGAVKVWVDVVFVQNENRVYFQVASPVIKITTENCAPLSVELLALNNLLYGAAFTTNREMVFIKNLREAEGLDVNEAYMSILRIGNYCEHYQQLLTPKYTNSTPATTHHQPYIPKMV